VPSLSAGSTVEHRAFDLVPTRGECGFDLRDERAEVRVVRTWIHLRDEENSHRPEYGRRIPPLRQLVKRSPPLYRAALAGRERRRRRRERRHWTAAYPSASRKLEVLREYARAYELRVLVETGTYEGETAWALRREFDRIVTVELSDELWQLARRRFVPAPQVEVRHGDSPTVLRDVLEELREPALFWLDAHVSTTKSAHGELPSPVLQELELVLSHDVSGNVVLVDDVRLLSGSDGWPAVGELEALVHHIRPELEFAVAEDVVRITPSR
jgi:hypothetical protein